jgi:uncharacterized membrane protein
MKKLVLLIALLWLVPHAASAKSWSIQSWDADITIHPDSSILVRETHTYAFEGDFTWVTRDLPKSKGIVYSDIVVYDDRGTPLTASEAEITNRQTSATVKLNFSASNTTKTWTFEYRARNAIGFFETYDELYWNVVSTDRDVPIGSVAARVTLPSSSFASSQIRQRLLTGRVGSTNESKDFSVDPDGVLHYDGGPVAASESFTLVAGWPKGFVTETKHEATRSFFWKQWGWFQWIYFASPIVVFWILFHRWRARGRDPKGRGTIVPQYEPPDKVRPGVMGTLIDEDVDMGDITASIIDLAVRGYIRIQETEKSGFLKKKTTYTLERRNSPKRGDTLSEFESTLLEKIFGGDERVELDDLKNEFYKHIKKLKELLYAETSAIGYFEENPEKVRGRYLILGILLVVIGVWAFVVPAIWGAMIIIFGMKMPKRTGKGVAAREWAEGFKMYLHTAERFRLQDLKPEYFETFLPYAMVFGVEKEWAARFVDIYKGQPDWYVGTPGQAFLITSFASNLSTSFTPSLSQVLQSSPSSHSGFGGGGFSGGGGGGGGSGAG